MSGVTNHDRREYMAGLIELMVERCSQLGVSYADEMSLLVLGWHASSKHEHGGSPSGRIVPAPPPIPEGVTKPRIKETNAGHRNAEVPDPGPDLHGLPAPGTMTELTGRLRGSRAFSNGWAAGLDEMHRESCPYSSGQGGYQGAWLTGFDEAKHKQETA